MSEDRIKLSAQSLKGIAHPVRVRLQWLLRENTATKLAERIGQSSGVTSYHLRQLAHYGFVTDDAALGNGRECWWRAVHRSTTLEASAARAAPAETGQTETGQTENGRPAALARQGQPAVQDEAIGPTVA
jgi:DNA-binding transcriptional ArsR family regulator